MMGDYLYDLLSCILFLKLVLFILNIYNLAINGQCSLQAEILMRK